VPAGEPHLAPLLPGWRLIPARDPAPRLAGLESRTPPPRAVRDSTAGALDGRSGPNTAGSTSGAVATLGTWRRSCWGRAPESSRDWFSAVGRLASTRSTRCGRAPTTRHRRTPRTAMSSWLSPTPRRAPWRAGRSTARRIARPTVPRCWPSAWPSFKPASHGPNDGRYIEHPIQRAGANSAERDGAKGSNSGNGVAQALQHRLGRRLSRPPWILSWSAGS